MAEAVRVKGLRELQRDFRRMSKDLRKDLDASLKKAADPVKVQAERLAVSRIRNMPATPRWAGMRIGVGAGRVYVVPSARRRGGSPRPNLGALLLSRSMEPALDDKQQEVVGEIERMLDNLADDYGF